VTLRCEQVAEALRGTVSHQERWRRPPDTGEVSAPPRLHGEGTEGGDNAASPREVVDMDAGGPATGLEDLSARADTVASELMARTRSLVPRTTRDHVSRRRLSVVLDGCTTPLVLLSAPAGSGKTALAAEWAHRIADARSVVWVSCHGEDADPLVEVLRGMRKSALTMPGATVEAGDICRATPDQRCAGGADHRGGRSLRGALDGVSRRLRHRDDVRGRGA
jgi:hypothetical protein